MLIHNYRSIEHTLNNYSSTFPQFQSIMFSMMHAPDSTLRCNVVRTINQILGNSLSVSTRHSHLGKLGSKCRGHPAMYRQLPLPPPTVISLSLKGVLNWVTCPQVQVFLLTRNYKYLLTKFILFSCHMKYETWASSMHWPWIIKYSKSSPSRDA